MDSVAASKVCLYFRREKRQFDFESNSIIYLFRRLDANLDDLVCSTMALYVFIIDKCLTLHEI